MRRLAWGLTVVALATMLCQQYASGQPVSGPAMVGDNLPLENLASSEMTIIDGPPTPPPGFARPLAPVNSKSLTSKSLPVPTSTWTYGCTPTAAGMLFAYYDRNGYPNMYTGPCNGGVCPMTDVGQGTGVPISGACSIIATQKGFDGRTTAGHVDDYWVALNANGPDPWVAVGTEHAWGGCVADFLGTSQWKWDLDSDESKDTNKDSGTWYYSKNSAEKVYDYIPPLSYGLPQTEACHGLRLFAESRGYTVRENYTQKIDALYAGGFSFADYVAEIDAGYPVLIQLVNHTVVGVGYDTVANTVYLNDTWDNAVHTMAWGESYAGHAPQAVTIIHLVSGADTTPPTGTIVINGNKSNTSSPNVTLTLTWSDGTGSGVSRMRFSNDGATWSAWEALAATKAYTLPSGDGYKTVRVQYLDKANNRSAVFSDYIRLDTALPTGGIIINHGDAATISQSVTLGLTWSDGTGSGVSRMRFSNNGSTWTAWEVPAATRAYTIPAGLGYHTVRVQYLDGANNYSAVYNDYIKLAAPPITTETVMLPGSVPLTMVWIPGGTFQMGRYAGEQESSFSEDPQHPVTVGGFWMAKYELTKRQWTAVMGTSPWTGKSYVLADLDSPAVYVSWNDAQSFLTAVTSYTGKNSRLPSEAQWEYACRGGTQTRFYWGDDSNCAAIGDYAWYWGNAYNLGQAYAHVVGTKLPNAFGLYDIVGNVCEWCEDDFHDDYTGAPTSGEPWVNSPRGIGRVFRGGSCWCRDFNCRSAVRYNGHYPGGLGMDFGFRIVWAP